MIDRRGNLNVPWQAVALNCVNPAAQMHLKVPIVLLQLACLSHGLLVTHSSMSSWQSPPLKPSGHSAHPVVSLQSELLSRQLQSRWQSLPHVPLRQAATTCTWSRCWQTLHLSTISWIINGRSLVKWTCYKALYPVLMTDKNTLHFITIYHITLSETISIENHINLLESIQVHWY